MRIITTIAALALMGTTATAGGLSDQIVEAPVIMEEPVAAGPSINPAFIVVGVLAALLIASAASDDDDDEPREREEILTACETLECLAG
ncbi:MAG: hypothetical protein AAFU41_06255 [Pseudomonadota bacterium]